MKKTPGLLGLFFLYNIAFGQNAKVSSYAAELLYNSDNKLSYVKLNGNAGIKQAEVASFINATFFENPVNAVALAKTETDQLGFTHLRFRLTQNGVELANKLIIAHCSNGRLISLNGDLDDLPLVNNNFSISEQRALEMAVAKVNAKKYKWENKEEERYMQEVLNDPKFSYAPVGQKTILEKAGKLYSAYCFNIYAQEPLYRANVFVDGATGKVLDEQVLICTTNASATAVTKYSGTQTFTNDYTGSYYRMRETGRGNGVETYNLHNTVSYAAATDFTNATSSWTTTGVDQAAADAHWGAEKTWDYYKYMHNRNSVDNNGYKLLSYVHYTVSYLNAFWDGTRMTYGDGNGSSYKIFTALDVCGHEISHGLTSNTGNLTYQNESGALNEAWSDIMGTSIEAYGKPSSWNWKIGEDITNGIGLRSMSNPNQFQNPDTYGGTYYYNGTQDYGGVHTNSSVGNYWFYLLCQGGTGINDLSNAYSVSGIGMTDAANIAFRAMTVYFVPSTNFAMARQLTIKAAEDLFGACSNQVIATKQAWYAVGVGANYTSGVGVNFNSYVTGFCSAPANVTFANTTVNGSTYTWDFGDGTSSTDTNAVHTYSAPGMYSVKLKATGCTNTDSLTKTSYIIVYPPIGAPQVTGNSACMNGSALLNGTGSGTQWYNAANYAIANGNSFATPNLTTNTTYYVSNTLNFPTLSGGILSNTGGGYSPSNTSYLVFDVFTNCSLDNVDMYTQVAGTRTVQLRDATNQVINSVVVTLTVGLNTVNLSFPLTPGTGYRLGLATGGSTSIYRTTTGVSYPYNVAGCLNITGANNSTTAYYYFYNWQVTQESCSSPMDTVIVTVYPLPTVNMNPPSGNICSNDVIDLQGSPAGGVYTGAAVNNGLFAPVSGPGSYTINYTYIDANSCSNASQVVLNVEECTGISSNTLNNNTIQIYPNPARDYLQVSSAQGTKLLITDAAGRIVVEKPMQSGDEKIQLEGISNGLYLVRLLDAKGANVQTTKLIKQ